VALRSPNSLLKWRKVLPVALLGLVAFVCYLDIQRIPFVSTNIVAQSASMKSVGAFTPEGKLLGDEIGSLAISFDGTLLAIGTFDGVVRLLQTSELRLLGLWQAHAKKVTALVFSPGSHSLVSAGADQTVARWSIDDRSPPQLIGRWRPAAVVTALAVAPGEQKIAVACEDQLEFRDLATGKVIREGQCRVPGAAIRALAFTADGRTIASGGGGDNAIRIWELTGTQLEIRHSFVNKPDQWIRALAYVDNSDTLVSLDSGGRVVAWDRDGQLLGEATVGMSYALVGSISPGAGLVLTKDLSDRSAHVWQLPQTWGR
jgi:WD40 repeat protein